MRSCKLTITLVSLVFIINTDAQSPLLLDSIIRYDFRGSDSVQTRKTIYFYDEFDQTIEERIQSWSTAMDLWVDLTRTTTSYQDGLSDTITQWIFKQSEWNPVTRTINSTDHQREKQSLVQNWDDRLQIWTNSTWTSQVTDSTSQMIRRSVWNAPITDWTPLDSTIRFIRSDGRVDNDTTYIWIAFANIYIPESYRQIAYDSTNRISQRIRYSFILDSMSFFPGSRDTFAYDENGFQIVSQFDTWDKNTEDWSFSLSIERMPNSDGNLAQSNIFFFDSYLDMVIPTSRLDYTYTDGLARTESDSLINTVKNYVYIGSVAVPDWKTQYYYSNKMVSSTRSLTNEQRIEVFPNPARDHVMLGGEFKEVSNYRWISLDGKTISIGSFTGNGIKVPKFMQNILILQLFDRDLNLLYVSKIIKH